MDKKQLIQLQLHAQQSRKNVLTMIEAGESGHMGGALSCIDILTVLYFNTMNVDPLNPKDVDRDWFILSAGHKAMAQYAVLAERGFFKKELLSTYGKIDSALAGHPNMHKLPGIEANTGALGHGLSISVGIALGLKLEQKKSKVFVVMGDGELPEGSNWEAISAASHYKLGNLVAFVDLNELQISGSTKDIMNMNPIGKRFESFGWDVIHINGNDVEEIVSVVSGLSYDKEKPTAIIAKTIKSKGLSFAENNVAYHYWKPESKELELAKKEVNESIVNLERRLLNEK